jgi:hypothetical protein
MNHEQIDTMSQEKRLSKISSILAVGILRLKYGRNYKERESFLLDSRSESRLHEENKNSKKTGGSS